MAKVLDNLVARHALIDTRCDHVSGYSKLFRPLLVAQRSIVGGQEPRAAPIRRLGLTRRPAAILGAVRAVVVHSIERMRGRWARSHIFHEALNAIQPTLTNGDASPAVSVVGAAVGVQAPFPHLGVGSVFRGVRHPVGRKYFAGSTRLQATAASGVAIGHAVDSKPLLSATRAPKIALYMPTMDRMNRQQSQVVKLASYEVFV